MEFVVISRNMGSMPKKPTKMNEMNRTHAYSHDKRQFTMAFFQSKNMIFLIENLITSKATL